MSSATRVAGRQCRVLLLAGTTEARQLQALLHVDRRLHLTTSLAGMTEDPAIDADVTGGFGGNAGLERYLQANRIDLVIDATHPFASRVTANAAMATKIVSCGYLRLERPPWFSVKGDRWLEDLAALPGIGNQILITTGPRTFLDLPHNSKQRYVLRMIGAPTPPLPPNVRWVQARPPFSMADEIALLTTSRTDALVTKNSGGESGYTKIEAARRLRLPVLLLQRPPVSVSPVVTSVDAAVSWLGDFLGRNT